MKARHIVLALFLLSAVVAAASVGQAAQDKPQAQQDQQQQRQQQEQPRRPTLGPTPAPSLRGPRSANIVDARKLAGVEKIYVERMDNSLAEKLTEDLAKTRRFQVVADRKDADAVLRGTCFDSRHLKSVRTEVYLNDIHGAAIWQDRVRCPYNPPPLDAAVSQTADLIVEHLSESKLEAERR
jgi:hypothetical protein